MPKTLEASAEAVGILAQTVADPGGRVMRALSASISSVGCRTSPSSNWRALGVGANSPCDAVVRERHVSPDCGLGELHALVSATSATAPLYGRSSFRSSLRSSQEKRRAGVPPILAVKPSGQWKCCRPLQARHSGRSPRCDSHLRGDFLKSVNCTQGKLTTVYRNDETSIALRMGISIPVMASISEAYL